MSLAVALQAAAAFVGALAGCGHANAAGARGPPPSSSSGSGGSSSGGGSGGSGDGRGAERAGAEAAEAVDLGIQITAIAEASDEEERAGGGGGAGATRTGGVAAAAAGAAAAPAACCGCLGGRGGGAAAAAAAAAPPGVCIVEQPAPWEDRLVGALAASAALLALSAAARAAALRWGAMAGRDALLLPLCAAPELLAAVLLLPPAPRHFLARVGMAGRYARWQPKKGQPATSRPRNSNPAIWKRAGAAAPESRTQTLSEGV